jgi:hypothetical protein
MRFRFKWRFDLVMSTAVELLASSHRPSQSRLLTLASGALGVALASSAAAQTTAQFAPADDMPDLSLPGLMQYAPAVRDSTDSVMFRRVDMEARLNEDGAALRDGVMWRVFDPVPDAEGRLPLVASSEQGTATFEFAPGDYFVHVAFGRAAVTKKLTVPVSGPIDKQVLILNAGGVVLNARSGDGVRIPTEQLRFSIYSATTDSEGERGLILADVKPDTIVRLNEGTYHVVSNYGSINASIRSDIHVQSGKLTEATIQHRAAQLTLKLVSDEGGEAIADTAWSILTATGDPISESVSAFPTLVLAEGEYTAVARHKDRVYQRDFTVTAGINTDIEVMLRQ